MANRAVNQSAAAAAIYDALAKPANRSETGKKRGNPGLAELGRATRFKKGEPSPNPSGRPRKLPLTERLLKFIDKKIMVNGKPDAEGRDWGDLAMEGLTKAAAKGKPEAAREMFQRIEGPLPNIFSGANGEVIPATVAVTEVNVQVESRTLITVIREIYGLQDSKTIEGVTAGNNSHGSSSASASSNGAGSTSKPAGSVPLSESVDTG